VAIVCRAGGVAGLDAIVKSGSEGGLAISQARRPPPAARLRQRRKKQSFLVAAFCAGLAECAYHLSLRDYLTQMIHVPEPDILLMVVDRRPSEPRERRSVRAFVVLMPEFLARPASSG